MIEKFFTQQQTLFRMRAGILGPHLPAIAKALDEAQYSPATIRLHLRAADCFGTWLQEKNIAVTDISGGYHRQLHPGIGPAMLPLNDQ